MSSTYEDIFFGEDAIFLERNSRDFVSRIKAIDANTEAVCDFLRSHPIVKDVFYPKYTTRENYDTCRIKTSGHEGGFGGLFSVTFTSQLASEAFFDALPCMKGPSLGTNFTLACPYTILAHYTELDWAAQWGVDKGLVRVSIGMEEKGKLLRWFAMAIKAAETAVAGKAA